MLDKFNYAIFIEDAECESHRIINVYIRYMLNKFKLKKYNHYTLEICPRYSFYLSHVIGVILKAKELTYLKKTRGPHVGWPVGLGAGAAMGGGSDYPPTRAGHRTGARWQSTNSLKLLLLLLRLPQSSSRAPQSSPRAAPELSAQVSRIIFPGSWEAKCPRRQNTMYF